MNTIEDDLRVMYGDRVAAAASSSTEQRLVARFASADSAPLGSARPVRRSWLAAGASAVAVAVVVAGAAILAHDVTTGPNESTGVDTVWNTADPGYPTQYVLGPSSMPGFELNSASLTPTMQSFTYDTPGHEYTYRTLNIDVVSLTTAARAGLTAMTPVQVGAVRGYFGTSAVTGKGVLQTMFGAAPAAKYEGTKVPDESVVAWAITATRWALLTGLHSPNGHDATAVFTKAELVGYAASVRPMTDNHAAAVRAGYLPVGLRFASAGVSPVTHLTPSQPVAAGQLDLTNHADAVDGSSGGASGSTMSFTRSSSAPEFYADAVDAPLTIDVIGDPLQPLSEATTKNPPALIFPGPWKRTTIRGHLAWESPRDVIIQWGKVQVGISTPRVEANHAVGQVSERELIKVANALVVPTLVGFGDGYPLLNAVPSGALAQR